MHNIICTVRYNLAKNGKHKELVVHLAQRHDYTYGYAKTLAWDLINQVNSFIESRENNKINIEPVSYGNYNHEEYIYRNKGITNE